MVIIRELLRFMIAYLSKERMEYSARIFCDKCDNAKK